MVTIAMVTVYHAFMEFNFFYRRARFRIAENTIQYSVKVMQLTTEQGESLSNGKDKMGCMNPLYEALSYYRTRNYEECIEKCTEMLKKNAFDKVAWVLKMRALTQSVYYDDIENEEETMADQFLDDSIIAGTARSGTSLRNTKPENSCLRPKTEVGHIVTGVVRANLRSARTRTMEQSLKSARRSRSSRSVSTQSGRYIRLGTASMVSDDGGPFVDVAKLNLSKYAVDIAGKHLFEYLLYHENDVQNSMELAVEAAKATDYKDWWWTAQIGKCYYRLSLYREAEHHFRWALKHHVNAEIFLRLIGVYKKLDQPLSALDVCKRASSLFPDEIFFTIESARIHECLNNMSTSLTCYRSVLGKDASNIEAIACVGLHYFYTDQPEVALRFYKRLLEMGLVSTQVLNNIGLCCFYSQQFDVALSCFKRALKIASREDAAAVWYNLSHVAVGVGDINLARNCLRLCLSLDGNHAAALNNLGVLELKRNNTSHAKSFFTSAIRQAPLLFEPNFNHAKLTFQIGDLQTSYCSARKAVDLSPSNVHAVHLLDTLKKYFVQL